MKNVYNIDYPSWTAEDVIFYHREMWKWIADESLKLKRKVGKSEYFDVMGILYEPENRCYLCEYDLHHGKSMCDACLVDWKHRGDVHSYEWDSICHRDMCMHKYDYDYMNIYARWYHVNYDYKEAAKLAYIIANLPIRKDVDII